MSRKIPTYRLHKPTGQAVVTLNGRDVYLGPHDTPESRSKYDQKIAEWLASGRVEPVEAGAVVTVGELVDQYIAFAETYYVKGGKVTSQVDRVTRSLDVVLGLYAALPAADFSPAKFEAVQGAMVRLGWNRRYVNQCMGCVRRAWKWAARKELVPRDAYHGLLAVDGLRAGRSAAPEPVPIGPAPEAAVRAVQADLSPQIRDLIEFQLWTGARPGEAVQIRPADVDRGGVAKLPFGVTTLPGVWVYTPRAHKTQHHGHSKIILIGPQAQAALSPYLFRAADAPCFSPREAEESRIGKPLVLRRDRPIGTAWTSASYARRITASCDRLDVGRWHPHQLRHNAATRIVAQFGWDVARIVLGHKSLEVTKIYVADDWVKAAAAVAKAG